MSAVPFYSESAAARRARVEAMALPGPKPQFGLAIIGAGMIGREHLRVATLLGRARVIGLYDTEPTSVQRSLADFATYAPTSLAPPRVYASLEEVCADPAVDGIFVCTPNFTHHDLVVQLLPCGKPLFVEKPMATTLADAAHLLELAASNTGFLQLGMQYRFKAQYVEAFKAAREGALGNIKTISMSEYRPPFLDKVGQWNKFNRFSGGTLVEKCCHYFDLINLMAQSEPHRVYATGGQAVNFLDFEQDGERSDIDDHAFVIIDYANGVRASFTLNMFAQELYEEMIVTGEHGRLLATEHSTFKREEASRATIQVEVTGHPYYQPCVVTYPAVIERSGHHGATFFEHEAFIDRLEGKATDAATPLQGLWAIIVASAAQASIAGGEPVSIPDFLIANRLHRATKETA
jgi:myo-inositol 2-dehydrogenase/D-chiro-inositol 1-dehydrogenase